LPAIHLDTDGFDVETTMNVRALRAGLKVVAVPSFEYKRIYGGRGRLRTFPDGWRVLKAIVREWLTPMPPSARRVPLATERRLTLTTVRELGSLPAPVEVESS
jgi:hypothetical protein